MTISSLTDIGVKRVENQDNYWSALLNVDGIEAGVVCLCDGMGGMNNGGLASRIVVEAVRDFFKTSIDFTELREVLQQANSTIYEIGSDEKLPMGTTCTVLFCYNGEYKILHVGDTRCYLLESDSFEPLTTDHSALKKYNITRQKDEKLYNKYKNKLIRCIGAKPQVVLDYLEGTYQEGDTFFVCSDGLWHYLDDYDYYAEELFDLPELIKKCINSGETDNITAGILKI